MIHQAKEALENLNSLVQTQEFYFPIFLRGCTVPRKINRKPMRLQRVGCTFQMWSAYPFPICPNTEKPALGVLFKFSPLLWNGMLLRHQSGKALRASDKTSPLHCGSMTWPCCSGLAVMAVEVTPAQQPPDRKKTNCENSDFIENQNPAARMLLELTQNSTDKEEDFKSKPQGTVLKNTRTPTHQGEFYTNAPKAAGKSGLKDVYHSHQTPNAFLNLLNS